MSRHKTEQNQIINNADLFTTSKTDLRNPHFNLNQSNESM